MVKNSDKTYGQLMLQAASLTDHQEIGETSEALTKHFKDIIEDAVQKNHDKGVRGKYYIHIWIQKEPYAQNSLRIYPQCRRTRPSPYQGHDHYLWSVDDGGLVKFEWCIPSKEVLSYILANPNEFDKDYVIMLRKYCRDKIETLDDYKIGIKEFKDCVG
jgi:hypothetical protein